MIDDLKRGIVKGVILSAWVVAYIYAIQLGHWIQEQAVPLVQFNMR